MKCANSQKMDITLWIKIFEMTKKHVEVNDLKLEIKIKGSFTVTVVVKVVRSTSPHTSVHYLLMNVDCCFILCFGWLFSTCSELSYPSSLTSRTWSTVVPTSLRSSESAPPPRSSPIVSAKEITIHNLRSYFVFNC